MGEETSNHLSAALLGALRPIASALLKCGIGYKDFAEICKRAFVEAATERYGIRGRPTNVSRVAVLTGLSRKEVGRIRSEVSAGRDVPLTAGCAAGDVLNRWTTNASYLTVEGEPIPLHFDSSGICFTRLVREAAGDIPPGAIKFELMRAGCVAEAENGSLMLARRHYVPADIGSRLIDGIHYGLRTMASTVEFNANESNSLTLRFQRVVHRGQVSTRDAEDIRKALSDYLTTTSHSVDDYLSKYQAAVTAKESATRVGVGLYYYEESDES